MSEDSDPARPAEWKDEPGDRLTRLTNAARLGMEADPEYDDDVKGIITLKDASGGGSAMWGYERATPEPVYDLIRASAYLFATLGIKLKLSDREPVEAPLSENGPHETVELTIIMDPGSERMNQVGLAVKGAVESAGVSWGLTKTVIMIKLDEGESAIIHHGLEDDHELIRVLLSAVAQVTEASGGHFVFVGTDESPN